MTARAREREAEGADLEVRNLRVRLGGQDVLRDFSFTVAPGERLVLLGPSGCGKTTSLRIIAGFIAPDGGCVRIAGQDMRAIPPERRNIGILFQNYALFPHLTAFENIAYGLRMRGVPRAEISRRVEEALALVRLHDAGGKRPDMLSGGEQQRIAFARAVVIRPNLLLLDEPFSNLDARLRQEMRGELLDLLQQLGITTVMVTHDQEEAMAIADRIVIIRAGTVEQIGSSADIYERPRSLFVARFVGESNLLPGRVAAAQVEVAGLGVLDFAVPPAAHDGDAVMVMLRPERIRVLPIDTGRTPQGVQRVRGVLERVQYLGHRIEYRLRVGSHALLAWDAGGATHSLSAGDIVTLEWEPDSALLFADEETP